ncbi:unnamed protein product [Tuber aestivum]|uniref:Uncharacterized protein n=1 Tax=Tuber aestivum TaxID=59557 RepID=A0A292Q3G4_9PEZI|nr:unnamed protein product [Tuber aestivum]
MDYRPCTPVRHDGPISHSVYPNIYFTPGRYSPRPTQPQLPTPSHMITPGPMAPFFRHNRLPKAKDITSVNEEQVAPIGNPKSAYTQEFVRRFKEWHTGKGVLSSPEGRENVLTLEITMPHFLDFKKALDIDNDEKFPRYSYDASSSLLTIQCTPSPIHEQIVSTVSEGFTLARRSLPTSLRRMIHIVGNQQFTDFQGAYDGSEKAPDTAVKVTDATGAVEVKFVLEVGLAETYAMLVRDAKMWIEGREAASIVMIVKMEETPVYKCPTRNLSEDEFSELGFPPRTEIDVKNFTLGGPYGPAFYKGLRWVGGVTGFMEIWKRDPVTRLATRTSSDRINLLNMANTTYTHFWLHDFVDISPDNDHHIPIDWGDYISNLGLYIKELAADRCRRTLRGREGRETMLDDDYEP